MSDARSRRQASAERRAQNQARAKKRGRRRTRARPIIRGASFKITLRCHERRFFLATGSEPAIIRKIYAYVLGLALERYGIEFHGANQMGNHHHLDGRDVRGLRPAFKCFFHSMVGRIINQYRGRTGDFWESGGSCDTIRDDEDEKAIMDLVYTDANPVSDGLVKWPELWPGFTSAGWAFGETRTFRRPALPFFDLDDGDWPEEVQITRVKPPCLRHLSNEQATALLEEKVREHCLDKQEEMRQQHRRFKQPNKIARVKWWKKATRPEDDFKVKPKVTVRDKYRRLEALQRDRVWEAAYLEADETFAQGKRDVVYPYGTWLMRVRYRVAVAASP